MFKRVDLNEQEKMKQARDYADCMMSLEMCYILNAIDKPSTAIKKCAKLLYKRIESHNVKMIMLTIIKAPLPVGRFREIRRQCSERMVLSEFIRMGVEAGDWMTYETCN